MDEINALLQSLSIIKKLFSDFTKFISGEQSETAQEFRNFIDSKVSEINRALNEASEAQQAARAKIEKYERKIAELENWETTKAQYEHTEMRGVPVYVLKEELMNTRNEPKEVCALCFENKNLISLHKLGNTLRPQLQGTQYIYCPACKRKDFVGEKVSSDPSYLTGGSSR